ncbi:MAG: DUF3251 domain-containing protein [Nitrospirae bacterium]|nr:DUF3251 domain-containing protein [Nitrospirota bacterium]
MHREVEEIRRKTLNSPWPKYLRAITLSGLRGWIRILSAVVLGFFLLEACSMTKSDQTEKELVNVKQKLTGVDQEISGVKQENSGMQEQLNDIAGRVFDLELSKDTYKTITIDLSSKGYLRLDTTSGFFMISVRDAKPYLNGFKVRLSIGNPTTVTYLGFVLNTKWGRSFDFKEMKTDRSAYSNWQKSLQHKEIKFTDQLKPATWNNVDLIIIPAKQDELGHFELSMETDQISLFKEK